MITILIIKTCPLDTVQMHIPVKKFFTLRFSLRLYFLLSWKLLFIGTCYYVSILVSTYSFSLPTSLKEKNIFFSYISSK